MSDSMSKKVRPVKRDNKKSAPDRKDALDAILSIVLDVLESPAATVFAERITNLVKSQWLPQAGVATDAYGLAALLNRGDAQCRRKMGGVPKVSGAGTHMVLLADMVRHMMGATDEEAAEGETSGKG